MYTCKIYIYIVIYTYANAYVCMHGLQPQTVRIYPIDAEDKIVGQEWMAVLTGKWLTASCRPFLPWWRDFPLHPQWIKDDKSLKKYHINARINPHSQPTNKYRLLDMVVKCESVEPAWSVHPFTEEIWTGSDTRSRRRKSTRVQRRKHTRSRRLFTYIDNMHNINNKNKINSSLNIDNTKTLTTTTTSSTFTSTSTPTWTSTTTTTTTKVKIKS